MFILRQMILTGCVAFARHVGPTRVEAELLPQCWEQVRVWKGFILEMEVAVMSERNCLRMMTNVGFVCGN